VHLVGFIIRIYHNARSPECQRLMPLLRSHLGMSKVNSSLCKPRKCKGEWRYSPTHSEPRHQMEDSGQLHTWPLYLQRKSPHYPFTRWPGGSKIWSSCFEKQKNTCPLPGGKPRLLECTPVVVLQMSCIWKCLKKLLIL